MNVKKMSMMINLDALRGASLAMSNYNLKKYLRSVLVFAHNEKNTCEGLYMPDREGQTMLVATDGHRLVVGMGPDENSKEVEEKYASDKFSAIEPHNPETWENTIVSADMVQRILKTKVSKDFKKFPGSEYIWLHRQDNILKAVFYDGQVVLGQVVDAVYPDFIRVFKPTLDYISNPSMVNGLPLNAKYLSDLDTFGRCFDHPKSPKVYMYGDSEDVGKPILFKSGGYENRIGYMLLMPMRK